MQLKIGNVPITTWLVLLVNSVCTPVLECIVQLHVQSIKYVGLR